MLHECSYAGKIPALKPLGVASNSMPMMRMNMEPKCIALSGCNETPVIKKVIAAPPIVKKIDISTKSCGKISKVSQEIQNNYTCSPVGKGSPF